MQVFFTIVGMMLDKLVALPYADKSAFVCMELVHDPREAVLV